MTRTTLVAASISTLLGSSLPAQRQARPTIKFVQVEREARLEVLDWGGTGRPVVLLAGSPPTLFAPPPETGINLLIHAGVQRYTAIRAPVLAIYALGSISPDPSAPTSP